MATNDDVDVEVLITEANDSLKVSENTNNQEKTTDEDEVDLSNSNSNGTTTNGSIELDAKQKKKLEKFIDHSFKKSGLNSVNTFEEKFYALAQKYTEQLEQAKLKENSIKDLQKNLNLISKQRDQLQHENSKSLLAKNKLESLCRELQRHNKAIKEENLNRTKEEEEKRKEISAKFQAAIDEINQQVSSNTDRNNSLIQENVQLAAKLKSLIDQYDAREQHMDKVLKHKDLENQLMAAKFEQAQLKATELNERLKQYEEHIGELNKKCEFHVQAENQLKTQLTLYTEKYEEFQSTLNKSNEVFSSFRSEMDKMTKKIKMLEKETSVWKGRWEKTSKSLVEANEKIEFIEKENKKKQLKADTMEQLSRTLQTERNNLLQKLKAYEQQEQKNSSKEKEEEVVVVETSVVEKPAAVEVDTNDNNVTAEQQISTPLEASA